MSQEQDRSLEEIPFWVDLYTHMSYLMKKVASLSYRLIFYGLIAYVWYHFFSFTPFEKATLILLGLIVVYLRNTLNILEDTKDLIGLFGFTNMKMGKEFYDEDELDFVDE